MDQAGALVGEDFSEKGATMIICPHCEKEIHAQEPHKCQCKMSRRFFFGLMAGAAAAVALPPSTDVGKVVEVSIHGKFSDGLWTCETPSLGEFLSSLTGSKEFGEKMQGLLDETMQGLLDQKVWTHPHSWRVVVSEWK